MKTDDDLYRSFLNGNDASYDELMIRYGDEVTFYLNGYLHDLGDAEDLMIEAFARIMVRKPRLAAGKYKAYLFRTARNLASRFHSRASRAEVFSLEEMQIDIADTEITEHKLLTEESKEALRRCMDRIDPDMKEALCLVYLNEMTYDEAASIMKVNTKKIDHLLERGKKKLKAELETEGITDALE